MSNLRYEIVDVFTDRPFAGNPLAWCSAREDLAGEQMQALAREFNLSETVVRAAADGARADLPGPDLHPGTELPFAGHPSVGAAVTAAPRGLIRAGEVVQECGAGLSCRSTVGRRPAPR